MLRTWIDLFCLTLLGAMAAGSRQDQCLDHALVHALVCLDQWQPGPKLAPAGCDLYLRAQAKKSNGKAAPVKAA